MKGAGGVLLLLVAIATAGNLPQEQEKHLGQLNQYFQRLYRGAYPEDESGYAVLTFDDAGVSERNAFSPCPSTASFTARDTGNHLARRSEDFGDIGEELEVRDADDMTAHAWIDTYV